MPNYSRFYKCDLHMHSPFDFTHWKEPIKVGSQEYNEEANIKLAERYISECISKGLEVIAVTDHNFANKPEESFYHYIRKIQKQMDNDLIVFPGFELEVSLGLGCHMLCIFPTDFEPLQVHDVLTKIGLEAHNRFSNGKPISKIEISLKKVIQVVIEENKGLLIPAHSTEKEKGIFSYKSSTEKQQQEAFQNESIVACETKKSHESNNLEKIFAASDDCYPEWKRKHPVARIMSSDCDSYESIARRYSWIKMSQPSIESLKQSFLDHESRIILSDEKTENPDLDILYTRIDEVKVNGTKFLKFFGHHYPIEFSPRFNCIIGSRGSGKSMLINTLYNCLNTNSDVNDEIVDHAESFESKINNDIDDIEIIFSNSIGRFKYTVNSDEKKLIQLESNTANGNTLELDKNIKYFLEPYFLLQNRVNAFIDNINVFFNKYLDIKFQYEDKHQQINTINQINSKIELLREKKENVTKMTIELKKLQSIAESKKIEMAIANKFSKYEKAFQKLSNFEKYFKSYDNDVNLIYEKIMKIRNINEVDFENNLEDSEHIKLFNNVIKSYYEQIEQMIHHYQMFKEIHSNMSSISQPFREVYNARKDLYTTEMAKNITENDNLNISSEKLFKDITDFENMISLDNSEILKLNQLNSDKVKSINELRKIYLNEFDKRKDIASKLSEGNYVKIEIDIAGDINHFLDNIVSKYLIKKQTLNLQQFNEFLMYIVERHIPKNIPITYELLALIEKNKITEIVNNYETTQNKKTEILRILNDAKFICELETYQIPNKINIFVKKGENNYISINQASYGEKALAIISIILSELNKRHIIIMDTPDEGIDSKCVYDYLVKQIKEMKKRKQIIIITHNANIPVVADAENIIVLSADNAADVKNLKDKAGNELPDIVKNKLQEKIISKNNIKINSYIGSLKTQNINVFEEDMLDKINNDKSLLYGKILKTGGLDREEIKFQVCEIMEGSEEAFKYRKLKYGF